MGIVKGLKAINQHIAAEEEKFSGGSSDGPKTKFFGIKDKQAFKLAFLQELDPDSVNYSTKNDLGFIATEHASPANFKTKALCTSDEDGCYGCEQHRKDFKAKWGQKTRLYINVLVDEGNGEDPYVAVLSQGNGPKSVTPALIEFAGDYGTITDKWYKVKRTGQGQTDTSYLLTPLSEHNLNVEDYELFDLEKVTRHVPYEEQAEFYNKVWDGNAVAESAPQAPANSKSNEW